MQARDKNFMRIENICSLSACVASSADSRTLAHLHFVLFARAATRCIQAYKFKYATEKVECGVVLHSNGLDKFDCMI